MERIEALMDPDNWEPNFTKIAEQTGTAVSTIRSWYDKQIESGLIIKERDFNNIIKIKNISEAEAIARRRE
jgi:hypothetical protein